MAPVWNLALAAVADLESPGYLDNFLERARRAPAAVTRHAVEALAHGARSLHLVTLSYSSSVLSALLALGRRVELRVSCTESRPALEGRRLAAALAQAGIPVACFGDAAIAAALADADGVVVGADAVGPAAVINKAGTAMLAAAAMRRGLPVHVLASRDKFVCARLAAVIEITHGPAAEIWRDPPPGVQVRNPYFEPTAFDLVTALVSDAGVIPASQAGDVCEATADARTRRALEALLE